jgi:hypothetical protein
LLSGQAERSKGFGDLRRIFYSSFFFSLTANSLTTILTFVYVVYGFGTELNPAMALELRILGIWVLPVHVTLIIAYYFLFYLTMKHSLMTGKRFKLWVVVLSLIPALSFFDLAFDLKSAL